MTTHVKVLAVLALVMGSLSLLGALFSSIVFGLLGVAIGSSHEEGAGVGLAVLGFTGLALTTYLVVSALISLFCGVGLLKRRRWARILGIIAAAVYLINFPIGTIVGAYALWVLFNKQTEAMFQS